MSTAPRPTDTSNPRADHNRSGLVRSAVLVGYKLTGGPLVAKLATMLLFKPSMSDKHIVVVYSKPRPVSAFIPEQDLVMSELTARIALCKMFRVVYGLPVSGSEDSPF